MTQTIKTQQILKWDELMEAADTEMRSPPSYHKFKPSVRRTNPWPRNFHAQKDLLFSMIDHNVSGLPVILYDYYSYYQRRIFTTEAQNRAIKAIYR